MAWSSPAPLPIAADCAALSESESEPLIASAATAQDLEPALLRAVIRQESAFRPCAVSAKGAMGLMQLTSATADQFKVADPFNAAEILGAGARYLKQLLQRFKGDVKLALAAYNAGPERVVDGAIPDIAETKAYVAQILKSLGKE